MTNATYTHLAIIADRSGSMSRIASDMNGAIRALLNEQAKLPGELHVDITTFDDRVEHVFTDSRADEIKEDIILPRNVTALNDAIGLTVTRLGERLAALEEEDRPGKVIVVIVTDGHENASHEWKIEDVKALVEKQKDEFSWEFLFLGTTDIDAFSVADGYGIGRGQTMSFAPSSAGVDGFTRSVAGYATRSRAGEATEFSEAEREAAAGS
jgi:hypothetical protein